MSKVIGRIDVIEERLRDRYDPNYHVYIFVENKELPVGDFNGENWIYSLPSDIEISEIKKPMTLPPPEIRRWKKAFELVDLGKWALFLLTVYSKLDKHETECEIDSWLNEEGYHASVFVYNAPKVMYRKITSTIPLTEDMLNKIKPNTTPCIKRNGQ